MAGIYESVLKAYDELKAKSGKEPRSMDLENAGGTVRVSAFFRKNGACEITVSAKPDVKLEKAVSRYGGRGLSYGANHEVIAGEDLYRIKLRPGLLVDAIEAELPVKIDAKDAKALRETFDMLKVPYESDDGKSLSVGTRRLHRKLKAEDCGKAFDVVSGSGAKYPFVFSAGRDSNVYASRRGVFVTLELGSKESEAKRRKRLDELQAFLGCGSGCEILDSYYELRFYSFGKEDAPGKKRGSRTTIE